MDGPTHKFGRERDRDEGEERRIRELYLDSKWDFVGCKLQIGKLGSKLG